jgi:hypothetical protein
MGDQIKKPKNILRGVALNWNIPEFIIDRPKSGFGISPIKWARKGGVFDPLIPLVSKCFDKNIIINIQFIEPKSAMTFWNILNYSIWKRLCIDNEHLDILYEEFSRSISDHNYLARTNANFFWQTNIIYEILMHFWPKKN